VGDRFGHFLGSRVRACCCPVHTHSVCSLLIHGVRFFRDVVLFWDRGVATVYAVKAAGLAIGIGIGSSCIVLVSFGWGIFVFHEPVHSVVGACLAILALIVGILGMSYYSSPSDIEEQVIILQDNASFGSQQQEEDNEYQELQSDSIPLDPGAEDMSPSNKGGDVMCVVRRTSRHHVLDTETLYHEPDGIMRHGPETTGVVLDDGDYVWIRDSIKIKKRHLGMSAAAFCGVWGGSILAVRTPQWVEGNNNEAVEFLWLVTDRLLLLFMLLLLLLSHHGRR
jgi:hypothetical protein